MTVKEIYQALIDSVNSMSECEWFFSKRPGIDNTRHRKLPFKKTVLTILSWSGGTLKHEIMDAFNFDSCMPSASAFVQQRAKIIPEAFESLFVHFMNKIIAKSSPLYNGLHLLAVDGTDLSIARDNKDPGASFQVNDNNCTYALLHINALYDLLQHTYLDAIIQKKREVDESKALVIMVNRLSLRDVLILADRGYESYNNLAHIQEKGGYFLIRAKVGNSGITSGLVLPTTESFDMQFHLNLTNKTSNEAKNLLKDKNNYKLVTSNMNFDFLPKKSKKSDPMQVYTLHFRVVKMPITSTTYEMIITNLPSEEFPVEEIKKLYSMRWGIETSFRDLKYTVGLTHLHSKKTEFICQEIFAKLIMYNFCELIAQSIVIKQAERKYIYKINFSDATHICLQFFRGRISAEDVEILIAKFITPIRQGIKHPRKLKSQPAVSFNYRIA